MFATGPWQYILTSRRTGSLESEAHLNQNVLAGYATVALASTDPGPGCLGAQLAISVHNCPLLTDSRFPMSIFKRTQRKYVKKAYRVRNWREYEAGLRNRGSLTVWISLTAGKLVNWDAPRPRRRKPGRQRKYSNHAIETAVTLGMVFHLSSRQSEGLLRSLFALMKLDSNCLPLWVDQGDGGVVGSTKD